MQPLNKFLTEEALTKLFDNNLDGEVEYIQGEVHRLVIFRPNPPNYVLYFGVDEAQTYKPLLSNKVLSDLKL